MHILNDLELDIHRESDSRARLIFHKAFNEKGIIYRLTAVLFTHDWNIISAKANTLENGQVEDVFVIESLKGKFDAKAEESLRRDLESLFNGEISVMHYLSSYPGKLDELYSYHKKAHKPVIEISDSPTGDYTVLKVSTADRPGLLFEISQLLYLLYVDILSFEAAGEGENVKDVFLLRREDGTAIDSLGKQRLMEALLKVL